MKWLQFYHLQATSRKACIEPDGKLPPQKHEGTALPGQQYPGISFCIYLYARGIHCGVACSWLYLHNGEFSVEPKLIWKYYYVKESCVIIIYVNTFPTHGCTLPYLFINYSFFFSTLRALKN